jgi:hypothetical protein
MQQPWLDPSGTSEPRGVPDDFSPRSATMTLRRAAIVVAVGYLLLLAGRSGQILDAAYGLPVLPGTDALIAIAEAWNDAMSAIGIAEASATLRRVLGVGR